MGNQRIEANSVVVVLLFSHVAVACILSPILPPLLRYVTIDGQTHPKKKTWRLSSGHGSR